LNNGEIGGTEQGPFVLNQGNFILGDKKGPHGYIIMPAGEAEQAKIVNANNHLLKRLAAYKSYYKIKPSGG
jgi:hypothetical protein